MEQAATGIPCIRLLTWAGAGRCLPKTFQEQGDFEAVPTKYCRPGRGTPCQGSRRWLLQVCLRYSDTPSVDCPTACKDGGGEHQTGQLPLDRR